MGRFSVYMEYCPHIFYQTACISLSVPRGTKRACHLCLSDGLSQKEAVFGGAYRGWKDHINSFSRGEIYGRGHDGEAFLSHGKDHHPHCGAGMLRAFAAKWTARQDDCTDGKGQNLFYETGRGGKGGGRVQPGGVPLCRWTL